MIEITKNNSLPIIVSTIIHRKIIFNIEKNLHITDDLWLDIRHKTSQSIGAIVNRQVRNNIYDTNN